MAAAIDMEAKLSDPAVERRAREMTCLPVLDKGCFCCTLTTCCKVQGWLSVIGGVAAPIILVIAAINVKTILDHPNINLTEEQRALLGVAAAIFWVCAVVGVGMLIAAIFFLVGIDKVRPSYFVPFMVLTWISMISQVIKVAAVDRAAPEIVGAVIGVALGFYFFLCAHSLYVRMKAALEVYPGGVAPKGTA